MGAFPESHIWQKHTRNVRQMIWQPEAGKDFVEYLLLMLLLYRKTKKGDIALIKLKEDDQMESRVEAHPFEPVNICDDDFDATGRDCFVSGWGHLKSHDRMVNMLQYSVLSS